MIRDVVAKLRKLVPTVYGIDVSSEGKAQEGTEAPEEQPRPIPEQQGDL